MATSEFGFLRRRHGQRGDLRARRHRRGALRSLWTAACLVSLALAGHRGGGGLKQTASAGLASMPLQPLRAAVVGAGPSGLLLAHRLLSAGARVDLFEGRSDPRAAGASLGGRAYALGLGVRGRTAIRTSGDELWAKVEANGFKSERFKLHLSPSLVLDLRTPEDNRGLEPSLLVYQSDICAAMLDALDAHRGAADGRLRMNFGTNVTSVDAARGSIQASGESIAGAAEYDLIAGCDGVNSAVRASIAAACPGFQAEGTVLPGSLKVLRFPRMPEALDATAVHAMPGANGTSMFVEPTANGACALVNWPADAPASLGDLSDPSEVLETLRDRFPLLADVLTPDVARQFVEQAPTQASTMRCNTYHFGKAVLLGDAAHSTGGVSGQGCNSALQDSAFLADELEAQGGDVRQALRAYSHSRVPEGQALLDLSLGPPEAAGPLKRGLYRFSELVGSVLSRFGLGGNLQQVLSVSLTPFAEIRRERDFYFGDFPSDAQFRETIASLDA